MIVDRLVSAIAGFGRFWYDFIVGDDWTAAAAVAAALIVSFGLRLAHAPAWWLLPLVVIASLALSLRRVASR